MKKKIRFAAAAAAAAMAIALLPQVGKQSVRADESESGDASTENVEIAINALNFPDPNFRSYITGAYDIYAPSGVLTQDEIDKALYFHIEEMNITSCKGIEFFTAAETFDCHGNAGLLELDLSNNPNLREVICRGCTNLSSLNVSGTTKLERLLCYNTALVTLDVSKNANLTHLDCAPNHSLKTLNVSGATRLGTLYCYGTEITELNLTNNPSLAYLDCYNCHSMKKLDLSGACNLTYVNCSESALEEIVFGKQMLLKELYAYENPLSNLDLSECPYLQNLDCRYTDLESLDVTACKGLLDLQCCYSNLSRLRVSNNPELRRIRCQGNPLTDLEIYACPFILETQEKGTLQLFDEDGVVVRQYSAIVPIDESASAVCEFTYNDSTKIHKIPTEHAVSVTTDGNGTASASVASGFEWTEVTLTANPNPGYQLKDWQVISGNVTVINHKFQIADANVHIKAIFEPISRAITVTTDGNGTASASASTGIIGDTITLTATPNAGYQFKEWQVISGGITITDNTFVIGT